MREFNGIRDYPRLNIPLSCLRVASTISSPCSLQIWIMVGRSDTVIMIRMAGIRNLSFRDLFPQEKAKEGDPDCPDNCANDIEAEEMAIPHQTGTCDDRDECAYNRHESDENHRFAAMFCKKDFRFEEVVPLEIA